MKCRYFGDCVGWPRGKVDALSEMVDNARDITRRTFLRHVCRDELESMESYLGYSNNRKDGMTMASDWHVSYHKSKLNGFTVYYFRHSSIEYVFTPEDFTWSKTL